MMRAAVRRRIVRARNRAIFAGSEIVFIALVIIAALSVASLVSL